MEIDNFICLFYSVTIIIIIIIIQVEVYITIYWEILSYMPLAYEIFLLYIIIPTGNLC